MSFTGQAVFGGSPFGTNGADLLVQNKQNPGLALVPIPTESGGLWSAFREIAGSQWIMQNADFGPNGFFQPNGAYKSYAFVLLAGGGFAMYSAPAGSATGFSWTRLFWVNQNGIIEQGGGGSVAASNVTTNTIATSASFVQLFAANPNALYRTIFNDTSRASGGGVANNGVLYLGYGAVPPDINHADDIVPANTRFNVPNYTGVIYGAWSLTGGNGAQTAEFTP